ASSGLFCFSLSYNNKSHYRMSPDYEFCLARAALPRKLALDEPPDPLRDGPRRTAPDRPLPGRRPVPGMLHGNFALDHRRNFFPFIARYRRRRRAAVALADLLPGSGLAS